MVCTEVKERNGKKYYYRVLSVRMGKKIGKQRIYLGVDLIKDDLNIEEEKADREILKENIKKAIDKLKPRIISVLKKYNVKKAGVFGSYSRGEQNKDSDVDIIIEPPKNMGYAFVGLAQALEESLGKKVDLITYKYINPHLKKYILEDEVRII